MSTTSKRKSCRDCGSKEEVIDGLCYTCEVEKYVYCNVCEELIKLDNALYRHRHVFEIDNAWLGSGGVDMDERYEDEIKQALFFVLDKIPTMASLLAHTIKSGKMGFDAIHLCIGIVLGPVMVFCYLTDSDGNLCCLTDAMNTVAHNVVENEDDEQIKHFEYAVRWLISLDNATKEANKMTLKWIEEWQKRGAA
jgi:hypothetical protein